jgi:uncharacterized protein
MTLQSGFPSEVLKELNWYVYRLIDPRNGHTFYVGKGKGNRVFQHAKNALVLQEIAEDDREYLDLKNQRILEILASGMEVMHVIHRHGITDENVAYEVEASLIEAYEGLANIAGGVDNTERGCSHAEELIRKYSARVLIPEHKLIAFSCGRSIQERGSAYDACRFAWILDRKKLESGEYKYALAVDRGFVVDVFEVKEWLKATPEDFPGFPFPTNPSELAVFSKRRTGFKVANPLSPCPKEIREKYRFTRIKGFSQNPVKYFEPWGAEI